MRRSYGVLRPIDLLVTDDLSFRFLPHEHLFADRTAPTEGSSSVVFSEVQAPKHSHELYEDLQSFPKDYIKIK